MIKFILGVCVGVQFSDEIVQYVRPLVMKLVDTGIIRPRKSFNRSV